MVYSVYFLSGQQFNRMKTFAALHILVYTALCRSASKMLQEKLPR